MTVRELIEFLGTCDPDLLVKIVDSTGTQTIHEDEITVYEHGVYL
jgi:phosphoribosyl-AMP cyclohydrolase